MRSLRHFAAALALLAYSTTMAASTSPADLSCRFLASTQADGLVVLQFALHNAGKRDMYLLRWGSPFEGAWFGPFVRVSTAQGELPFQGALRKRGEPSAQDYLLLRTGQTLEAELSLADAYALPAAGGPLTLTAAWRWHDVMADGKPPRARSRHHGLDQDCGTVTLRR